MLKKKMSWLLAATMVASMGMGCVPAAAEESTYDGTIRWLNYKPEIADQMKDVMAAYKEETGIDIEIETAASNQYEPTLTARMDSSEAPTIFVVDGINMLNTWKDYIMDLSDTELYSYVTDDR